MKHFEVKYFDHTTLVHFDGISQPGDISLCGSDLVGDETLGYYPANETNKRVNCVFCQQIVKAAKKIKSSELELID